MKKFLLRLLTVLAFCISLLVIFLLNPSLAYSHATNYKNMTIYHNQVLPEKLTAVIDLSLNQIAQAKIYQADFQSDLCLNDGAIYPKVVQAILGDDVFTAFSNKIVVLGAPSSNFNRFYKWGKELKYSQFLNHALMHNLQFKHHGLLDANPLGGHPHWKWEGYVEYEVLGQKVTLTQLKNILNSQNLQEYDWVNLTTEEGTVKAHIKYLALTKFCFEVLQMDYVTFMKDDTTEDQIYQQLMAH